MADFTIKDNHTDEILAAMKERVSAALEAVGAQAENYAKMKCPVDTGLLRNSITHAVSGNGAAISGYHAAYGSNRTSKGNRRSASSKVAGSVGVGRYTGTIGDEKEAAVYIGTNVEYAPYVELGTSHHKEQPFLKPAVVNHVNEYKRIVEAIMKT